MGNFTKTINELPMDPKDDRLFYGIDFVNVVDDGGSMVNPTVTISTEGQALGVTANDVSVSGTQVLFRPSVASGNQADVAWNGDGQKIEVTATFENATAKFIQRSGYLRIAQR